MSKAKFVTVSCQCGKSFDREVKRGRPQIWCADCLAVPFYERARAQAPVVVNEAGESVVKTATVDRPHDTLGEFRDAIEEGVATINAEHKARFEALVAGGADKYVAAAQCSPVLAAALTEFYGKYR